MNITNWNEVVAGHPAAEALKRVFAEPTIPRDWQPSGLARSDYLRLVAGNVDFWKRHQNDAGAVIDPYENRERQYSTPAFAHAAATLVAHADRADLLGAATRAMSFATAALANQTTADNHPDFYIPMLMHARRLLEGRVPQSVWDVWTQQLQSLVPEAVYRDATAHANWNIVHECGECLRRKDGLVREEHRAAQSTYIEQCLSKQQKRFTPFGMYEDPNAPLAYDAFPRLWLEDVVVDGAYDGTHRARLEEWLRWGGLSTLLLLSPIGEWASGGRSAHHQWNEAEVSVICEINARHWQGAGHTSVAGAFKRAARLALSSMQRWQRPSGELWIVKNRADPTLRHGYEGYSFHSQYNLLAMSMLCIAFERADDTIEERPMPSEIGGYVFDARQIFHKVAAAAGGYFALIDTGADAHYNATGLLRVHRAGVASSFNDNAPAHRGYGPKIVPPGEGITPGLMWRGEPDRRWLSLADYPHAKHADHEQSRFVREAELLVSQSTTERVALKVLYTLHDASSGARQIEETYVISEEGVEVEASLLGDKPQGDKANEARVAFPILVHDGAFETGVTFSANRVRVQHAGAYLTWDVLSPMRGPLVWGSARVATQSGWMQAAVADLPANVSSVRYRVRLEKQSP
ncbi:MAG: hypothetical protein JWN98_1384 [Abditibacteriota bacterium]|nr:hypothetical protein [Abditibacteriota bacterium]